MEEEEQDIIEVDKSLLDSDTRNKKTLASYCCAQTLNDKGTARVWEHNGGTYIITGMIFHGNCPVVPFTYEVLPLIPGMPSVDHVEYSTIRRFIDGWLDKIDDELVQKIVDIESYFEASFTTGSHVGQRLQSGKNMYVCNGKQVNVVAKEHGNQIQESFSFAEPAQLELTRAEKIHRNNPGLKHPAQIWAESGKKASKPTRNPNINTPNKKNPMPQEEWLKLSVEERQAITVKRQS